MNKCIYVAAIALVGSSIAQEQSRKEIPKQAPTSQPAESRSQANPSQPAVGVDLTRTSANDRAGSGLKELFMDWRLEDLPPAVQKTAQEQSKGAPIKDIDRDDRGGQPSVWEIEFEQAGKNREVRIREDGSLIPENERRYGRSTDGTVTTARPGERAPASGTPGAIQTGRSVNLGLGTQWEDLPPAVQQKAAQFGGKDKVADIDREEWNGRVAYEVEFRREGRNLELLLDQDGTVLESSDPNAVSVQRPTGATDTSRAQPRPGQNSDPVQPDATRK
jgi:uncharacterized membrane protein YkoI